MFANNIVATLFQESIDYNFIARLSSKINVPICFSGGIKNIQNAFQLFKNGASKISINSYAVYNPNFIKELTEVFGSQSISSQIQLKLIENNWEIFTHCGRERRGVNALEWIQKLQDKGIGEIHLLFIDNDGIGGDYDYRFLEKILEISQVPILIGGGINSYDKLISLSRFGLNGCLISSSLHNNSLSLTQIKRKLKKAKIDIRI